MLENGYELKWMRHKFTSTDDAIRVLKETAKTENNNTSDITVVLEKDGHIIGISTYGDSERDIKGSHKTVMTRSENKCDIFLCACRPGNKKVLLDIPNVNQLLITEKIEENNDEANAAYLLKAIDFFLG